MKPINKSRQQRDIIECLICGGNYFIKFCPEKRCTICGAKGHRARYCPNMYYSKEWRVYQVSGRTQDSELSVALTVRFNKLPYTMLLNSGGGPSEIDIETVRNFGLETTIH